MAADEQGDFAIKGGGAQSCTAFQRAFDEGTSDVALYGGWIEGYITGLNQHVADTFDLAPWQGTGTLLSLTKLACDAAEPGTSFMRAFNEVVRALAPARLVEKSDVDVVQSQGRAVPIYEEVVRRIQAALVERGAAELEATGTFDARTAEALRNFQREAGLEETGLPDQPTLAALFLR